MCGRLRYLGIIGGTTVALLLTTMPVIKADDAGYVPGMILVRFSEQFMPTKDQVSLQSARFGIADVDSVLEAHAAVRVAKFLPTYASETSEAGRYLERSFIVYYQDGTDPATLVDELSRFACFEEVQVNARLVKDYGGTKVLLPKDSAFQEQWNLNNPLDDRLDIDAPEAWAIETGDSAKILGVIDAGTMVDLGMGHGVSWESYRLHSDMKFFFNDPEDNPEKGQVGADDLDGTDANDTDSQFLPDNVIGYNWSSLPDVITDPLEQMFWSSMPHFWQYQPVYPYWVPYDHGIRVASIAAAVATFTHPGPNNIAGVANGCRVYTVRDGGRNPGQFEETLALITAADFADVINMSWVFQIQPPEGGPFENAVNWAAIDKDRVLVSITGNDTEYEVGWPARYPLVLAVGNMGRNFDLYDSQYGPNVGDVDVVAPVDQWIPTDGVLFDCEPGPDPLQWQPCEFSEIPAGLGGTSSAAPQAAGVAALIRSRFPGLNQQEVRNRITRSAEWLFGEKTELNLKKFGSGKINAYRALTEWGSVDSTMKWYSSETTEGIYSRDGVFYISGDLTIEPGATLIINPGVTVRVAPDNERQGIDTSRVEIVVKGTLEVLGTLEDPVVFESFTDSPAGTDDWVGIWFASTSQNSVLEHAVIKNALTGIGTNANLTIKNCTIEDCGENGMGIAYAESVYVQNTTIRNCGIRGINLLEGTALRISNSLITGSDYGIAAYSGATLYADSTEISSNDQAGIWLNLGAGQQTPTSYINKCTLKHNDIGIDITGTTAATSFITNCLIDSNTTTGVWCGVSDNLVLVNNRIQHSGTGVFASGSDLEIRRGGYVQYNDGGSSSRGIRKRS